MATPNYMLTEECILPGQVGQNLVLPAGAFIRPIELKYVPKEVLSYSFNRFVNLTSHCFCYTRYGIHAIAREKIRKAE